jgi:hypothetical protein
VVTVRVNGEPEKQAQLRDISITGAAVCGAWQLAAGHEVELELPFGCGAASARVVHAHAASLAVLFRSDKETLARVSRAVDTLQGNRAAA